MAVKLKPCRCGEHVERHLTANRGWIVYCPDCSMAFGVTLDAADVFDPDCISGEFETAEQAAIAWNEWIGGEDDDES